MTFGVHCLCLNSDVGCTGENRDSQRSSMVCFEVASGGVSVILIRSFYYLHYRDFHFSTFFKN
jgi:hypothetical protein